MTQLYTGFDNDDSLLDGSLLLYVDSFGSFGSKIDGENGGAFYDPLGDAPQGETTYRSQVAIRFNDDPYREFLNDISDIEIIDDSDNNSPTSTLSTFTTKGLNFKLTQSVSALVQERSRSGSNLLQVYEITNPTNASISIELIRYFDGDLNFGEDPDESSGEFRKDTGGRLIKNGQEVLFETDSGDNFAQSSRTFVGITAEGGTKPNVGRYEIGKYDEVRSYITNTDYDDNGNPYVQNLIDGIEGDTDGNGFIDQAAYDLALALNNKFIIINLYSFPRE